MSRPIQFAHISESTLATAQVHLRDVLKFAFEHGPEQTALVVSDGQCELAQALTEAYRRCLPHGRFVAFEESHPQAVLDAFEPLQAGDLVVLIQSTSFRLDAFRIRVHLFQRSLKVIEHPHLARMLPEEAPTYIDSLAYDPAYFRGVGRALKQRIDVAREGVIETGGQPLLFPAGFDPARLNVGDYREMQNVGGQFPIGEVFTESKDLQAVSGHVRIAHFGDTSFSVRRADSPITLVVERGRVSNVMDSTPEFEAVLADIRRDEGEVWVRELGFGLNRAFSLERTVTDIGTFERMCGVHLSLGSKHASYNKPEIRKKTARYHVDVFASTKAVRLDGEELYRDGRWLVTSADWQ